MKDKSKKDQSKMRKSEQSKSKKTKKEKLLYDPDVTEEDLEKLKQEDIKGYGDDRQLRQREKETDFAGEDLDVPGTTKRKEGGKKELPDEENKLYGREKSSEKDSEDEDKTL